MGSHSECNTTFIERSKVPKNDDLKSQIEYSRYRYTVYMICGISVNGWINIAYKYIGSEKRSYTAEHVFSFFFSSADYLSLFIVVAGALLPCKSAYRIASAKTNKLCIACCCTWHTKE